MSDLIPAKIAKNKLPIVKRQVLRVNGRRFLFIECGCGRVHAFDVALPNKQNCGCGQSLVLDSR